MREVSALVWVIVTGLLVVPTLHVGTFANADALIDLVSRAWRKVRRRPDPVQTDAVPLEAFQSDLRRLVAFIEQLDRSDAPALAARLRAAVIAYDDVLLIACRALQIPAPERGPLDAVCRLQTEADLALHGLEW